MKATLLFPDREIVERYYVPLIYTACRTCYSRAGARGDLPARRRRRDRPAQDAEADQRRHRVRPRLHDRAHRLHVRASAACRGRCRTSSSATARASPSTSRASATSSSRARRRCSPTRSPRATRTCASATRTQVDGALELYGELLGGRHPRRGRPVRLPERDPHEPGHDHEPAGAHPHVRPAPVHDGPVGDPPAVPADPPRDLRGVAVPGSFLAPKCVPLGYCDEINNRDGHCPIRPHKDRVLEAWAEKAKAAAKAAGRELPVQP